MRSPGQTARGNAAENGDARAPRRKRSGRGALLRSAPLSDPVPYPIRAPIAPSMRMSASKNAVSASMTKRTSRAPAVS